MCSFRSFQRSKGVIMEENFKKEFQKTDIQGCNDNVKECYQIIVKEKKKNILFPYIIY